MSGNVNTGQFTRDVSLRVKCVAVCLLVFHHLFRVEGEIEANLRLHVLSAHTLSRLATNARVCVWIYVFLSAYGMAMSYGAKEQFRRHKGRYFLHRVLGLQQFYLPFLVIDYILVYIVDPTSILVTSRMNLFVNVLGIADLVGRPAVDGIYWYISFTLVLALFLPMLYELCEKYGWLTLLMAVVLQIGFVGAGISSRNGGLYMNYFSAVVAGIMFAQNHLWEKLPGKLPRKWNVLRFIGLLACVLILPDLRNSPLTDLLGYKQWLMTGATLALCWLVLAYEPPGKLGRAMTFVGKHSANMYLIHMMLFKYLKVVDLTHDALLSYLIYFLLSLGISVAVTWLLERAGYNRLFGKLNQRVLAGIEA